jgi:hypothetical protein
MLGLAYKDVGRRSLGVCSQPVCLVYVYVVFYLDFYTFDIEIWGYLECEYIENVMCNLLMYSTLI